jgi:[ribosomal protein S18]-alanine N-acetyltransferase
MTSPSTNSAVLIRPMTVSDIEQVHIIDQLSFSLPWPASAFSYELNENPLSMLYVAEITPPEEERRIIGMIVVWPIIDEAHIATLAVHPDYRNQGIGQIILATALREAIYKGCRVATLEVRATNLVAQRLYRRFHFEVVGSRQRYYRDNNEDALIMTVSSLGKTYLNWLETNAWKELN